MSAERDYAKVDGIPNERWEMAEVIYSARIRSAWGQGKDSMPPAREGYTHGKQVADFDLALECAKAIQLSYVCVKLPPAGMQ